LMRVFDAALHLLHPFMPFITEELWHQLPRRRPGPSLSLKPFGLVSERVADPVSERQFEAVQELVVVARNAKAEMGLQTKKPGAQVASDDVRILELLGAHQEIIVRLAGVQALNLSRGRLAADLPGVRAGTLFDLRLIYEEQVDLQAERARLQKEKEKTEQALAQAKKQLDNKDFLARAPQEVVRGVERRHAELAEHLGKIVESLAKLK
jgi:valyl-tRNA synthetase